MSLMSQLRFLVKSEFNSKKLYTENGSDRSQLVDKHRFLKMLILYKYNNYYYFLNLLLFIRLFYFTSKRNSEFDRSIQSVLMNFFIIQMLQLSILRF